jgi:hypothetical protein
MEAANATAASARLRSSSQSQLDLRVVVHSLRDAAVWSLETLERGDGLQAYCMKCKTQREMKDPQQITMKNGRPATQGACPTCGTKMFKIGAAK